jgi:CO dehydrogenase/acetyl-CoA synthase alpha subunit
MWVKWKLVADRFEIVLIPAQDRCTVCAECTIGMEIVLGATGGSPM